jgi:hypothetical protein
MEVVMKKHILVVLCMFLAAGADAVIVAGGGGTQNTIAPTGGQGWDYVGKIDHATANSSVTYISNNWFITAYHVQALDNPTSVLLGGSSYSIDAGSWTRLQNSVGGDADLAMFRVASDVGMPGLTVRSSGTANGSALTMIGNGRNRASGLTQWNVNTGTDPWTWTEIGAGGNASGYKWASGSTKRWGTNNKDADLGLVNDGFGITDMFYTDFDPVAEEAQGATYDSGGGVFVDSGGSWELAGIMLTTTGYSGQPGSTAVFGNTTYIADMQHYAGQISATAAIPEPAVLVLMGSLPLAAFFIRRIFVI